MTGHHGSKFGYHRSRLGRSWPTRSGADIDVLGLHVHVGSQLPDFTAQEETIRRLAEFAAESRDALGWEARIATSEVASGFVITPRRRSRRPPLLARRSGDRARGVRHERVCPGPRLARAGPVSRRPRRRHPLPRRCGEAARRPSLGRGRRRNVGQPASPALRGARYTALSAQRADEEVGRARQRRGHALRVGRRAHRRRRASLTAARRPARGACDRRVHAGDELELQRRHAPSLQCCS